MTQAVRLLSQGPFLSPHSASPTDYDDPPPGYSSSGDGHKIDLSLSSPDISDPFTSGTLTYSTTGYDTFPAPSSFSSRRYSWLHIFPEGRVHQHPKKTMRYFKWGVARLILEPPECPDIVPIWIEGNDEVMHESRPKPRWKPAVGKNLGVWYGENVGGPEEGAFKGVRSKWRTLVERERRRKDEILGADGRKALEANISQDSGVVPDVGDDLGCLNDELKYGREAVLLRVECTQLIREEVLKVRRQRGLPDEDPKQGLVETWREEGITVPRTGQMQDGSWVREE
ncbi:hypothetical protein MMC25_003907 [Agyrium rufum]|nr:hypothetical protein [Agyrium rufum]